MSFTLCSSYAIVRKAGANVNTTAAASGALLAEYCDQAEAFIATKTRKDWVSNYASVSANFKPMLADCASDLAAMKLISYDMSGYTSRLEVQTMLDFYRDNSAQIMADLKEKEIQEVFV